MDVIVLRTHIDCIAALFCDAGDGTESTGRKHDLVVVDERVFVDTAKDVTS